MASASFLIWLTKWPALYGLMSSATLDFCSVARNPSSCSGQVSSVYWPPSQAL